MADQLVKLQDAAHQQVVAHKMEERQDVLARHIDKLCEALRKITPESFTWPGIEEAVDYFAAIAFARKKDTAKCQARARQMAMLALLYIASCEAEALDRAGRQEVAKAVEADHGPAILAAVLKEVCA